MFNIFRRLFCDHKHIEFVRNVHGDEICDWGYLRSIWSCRKCGAPVGQPDLVDTVHRDTVDINIETLEQEQHGLS